MRAWRDTRTLSRVRTTTTTTTRSRRFKRSYTSDNRSLLLSPAGAMFGACDDGEGAARRRRERRLRSWLKHERQRVALALSEQKHHTSRGQRKARAGRWVGDTHFTAKFRENPPSSRRSSSCRLKKSPAGRRLTGTRSAAHRRADRRCRSWSADA